MTAAQLDLFTEADDQQTPPGNPYQRIRPGVPLVIPSDAARAVGRFRPEGPIGYRASNDAAAPLRSTRQAAVEDYIAACVAPDGAR